MRFYCRVLNFVWAVLSPLEAPWWFLPIVTRDNWFNSSSLLSSFPVRWLMKVMFSYSCHSCQLSFPWFLTIYQKVYERPDTFRRVFERINPNVFERCFRSWVESIVEAQGARVIPIDGKTLKGSYDRGKGKSAIHLVSAWSSEYRLVLGQVKVADKPLWNYRNSCVIGITRYCRMHYYYWCNGYTNSDCISNF